MLPGFAADVFELPQGVYSVWCQDQTVYYNDGAITITQLLEKDGVRYTAQKQ